MLQSNRPEMTLEEALAKIQCEEFVKLRQSFPEMDFTEELRERPHLAEFLQKQIQFEAAKVTEPLNSPNAPKLNEDFSNYFMINNLPKCEEAKVGKLKGLIMKASAKQNLVVKEEDIDIPIDEATNETVAAGMII